MTKEEIIKAGNDRIAEKERELARLQREAELKRAEVNLAKQHLYLLAKLGSAMASLVQRSTGSLEAGVGRVANELSNGTRK